MILLMKVEIQHRGILEGSTKKLSTGEHKRTCQDIKNHEGMVSRGFVFLVNNLKPHDPKHLRLPPMATVTYGRLSKNDFFFSSKVVL